MNHSHKFLNDVRTLMLCLASFICVLANAQTYSDYSINGVPGSNPEAPIGAVIIVNGSGFSPTANNNLVFFTDVTANLKQVPVMSVMGTSGLQVTVPDFAVSGPMAVKVNNVDATGSVSFTAATPLIAGFFVNGKSVQAVTPGQTFVINGKNFNPLNNGLGNTVKLNSITFPIVGYSPLNDFKADLTVTVPTDGLTLPTTGPLIVSLFNGLTSGNGNSFTVENSPVLGAITANEKQDEGAGVGVEVAFSNTASLQHASLSYRAVASGSDAAFTSVDMALAAGKINGVIPGSVNQELGVEYKIRVYDFYGLSNSDSVTLHHVKTNYPEGIPLSSYSNASGKAVTNYRIIAIPVVPVNPSINNIFTSLSATYDPKIYRLFNYNGTDFIELNGSDVLDPGRGYWFIAANSVPLSTGAGVQVDATNASPFPIALQPGWNQIGNPYNFNIAWSDVIDANPGEAVNLGGNSSKVRVFRGAVGNEDVLHKTEGGFVKYLGNSPSQIIIPVKKNLSIVGDRTGAPPEVLKNPISQPAWEVRFDLSTPDFHDVLGGFGMNPQASEGPDQFDDFASPHFLDYLEVKYPRKFANMTFTKDIIPSSDQHVWQFEVASNLQEMNTTLVWDNSYFGTEKELYLLDLGTLRAIDMKKESQYRFNRSVSKSFKVVYGSSDFVKTELTPDKLMILDPYPNPFNDKITFDFAFPANQSNGAIEVIDIAGARVASVNTGMATGIYHWEWDSEGKSPGLYLVRVISGSQTITRKIIKR